MLNEKWPAREPAFLALPVWTQTLRESDRTPSDTSPDSSAASARSAIDPPSRLPGIAASPSIRSQNSRQLPADALGLERLVDHVVDERRFSRAGHAGDRNEQAQRNHQVDALQIVAPRAEDLQELPLRFPPPLRHRNAQIAAQVAARDATQRPRAILRAFRKRSPCRRARPRPDRDRESCPRPASYPDRARRQPACFPSRAGRAEFRSGGSYRADARPIEGSSST